MTWWYCATSEEPDENTRYVWINCERWFDARKEAWRLLATEKVWISHSKVENTRPPKQAYKDKVVYEGKWVGSASGVNDLHFETHRVLVRKLRCKHCDMLLWPWQVEFLGGQLRHLVMYERGPGDPPGNGYCGPVGPKVEPVVERSATALPDALPYEDEEIPPSLVPPPASP